MPAGIVEKWLAFLRRPYPHLADRRVILILVPLFISLFMVTFQPFGLQKFIHEYKSFLLLGYGLVTLLVLAFDMYVLPLLMPKLFSEERWLVMSEVLFLSWIVLSISAGNYIYSVMFSITAWNGLSGLFVFIGFTFAISVIPITSVIIFSYNIMLRKNLAGADEISRLISKKDEPEKTRQVIFLASANKTQELNTTAYQLLFIESEGNYVHVWILEEGKIIHHIIRNTIKNIEAQLGEMGGLFRCHRAFIVNLRHIMHAEGNSQGYRLKLKYLDREIPVSRNYTKDFNKVFREWQ